MGAVPPKFFLPSAPYGSSQATTALSPVAPAAQNPQTPLLPPNFTDPGTMSQQTQQTPMNPSLQSARPQNKNPLYGMFGRGLFALLLLLPSSLWATTTVTGKIQNLGTGNITSGAFVRFWLRGCAGNQPRVNGTGLIAPSQGGVFFFDIAADASGNVSGTLYSTRDNAGTGNGDIECGGSKTAVWYGMQAWVAGKSGPEVAVHAKNASTLDITQVTPITTNPVIAAPTGDSTYARLDGGNTPFTGNVQMPGANNQAASLNGVIFVDGNTYALTAAGVRAALNAASASGARVVLPPGTISGDVTAFSVPSNVCLVGAGPFSTILRWTVTPTAGITIASGVNNACIQNLGLSFSTATNAASGIQVGTGGASATQYNTVRDVSISWDGNTTGTAALTLVGQGGTTNVSLNHFENIIIQRPVQAVNERNAEGNTFKLDASNLGGVVNNTIFWQAINVGDEVITARLEAGTSATGDICFQDDAASSMIQASIVCDTGAVATALNDLGNWNIFDVTAVGPGVGTLTLGTVGVNSQYRYTDTQNSKVVANVPAFTSSALTCTSCTVASGGQILGAGAQLDLNSTAGGANPIRLNRSGGSGGVKNYKGNTSTIIFGTSDTGVDADAAGFKHKRVAGCATAASLNATCDTTVTWGTAFADASYTVVCTGDVVTSGVPIVQGIDISAAKTGAAITVRTLAITAAAAQFTTLDCSATHD